MENILELRLIRRESSERLPFRVDRLWNGGWAGRNQADVQKHVDELASHGVPAPATVPIYFPLTNNQITTAAEIQVLRPETSGEVEYVLLFGAGETYIGVASDHSDRAFERYGIQPSKQMYPDVIGPHVWTFDEVRSHWDQLELRCWVTVEGQRRVYQEVTLAELLSAEQWLEIIGREGIQEEGTAFLSGAPPTLGGLVFGERYDIELFDPRLNRALRHGYDVRVLPPGVQ